MKYVYWRSREMKFYIHSVRHLLCFTFSCAEKFYMPHTYIHIRCLFCRYAFSMYLYHLCRRYITKCPTCTSKSIIKVPLPFYPTGYLYPAALLLLYYIAVHVYVCVREFSLIKSRENMFSRVTLSRHLLPRRGVRRICAS